MGHNLWRFLDFQATSKLNIFKVVNIFNLQIRKNT